MPYIKQEQRDRVDKQIEELLISLKFAVVNEPVPEILLVPKSTVAFEAILTDVQKAKLAEMKAERKARKEERKQKRMERKAAKEASAS